MKPTEAINKVIVEEAWLKLCYKWCNRDKQPHFANDLYQEFCLIMLEYKEEKVQNMLDNAHDMNDPLDLVRLTCYRTLNNMWNSSTSRFYKKYRKHFVIDPTHYEIVHVDPPINLDAFLVKYQEVKSKCPKRLELMTRLYAELGSYREIERELGINHQTAFRYVREFRDIFNSSDN